MLRLTRALGRASAPREGPMAQRPDASLAARDGDGLAVQTPLQERSVNLPRSSTTDPDSWKGAVHELSPPPSSRARSQSPARQSTQPSHLVQEQAELIRHTFPTLYQYITALHGSRPRPLPTPAKDIERNARHVALERRNNRLHRELELEKQRAGRQQADSQATIARLQRTNDTLTKSIGNVTAMAYEAIQEAERILNEYSGNIQGMEQQQTSIGGDLQAVTAERDQAWQDLEVARVERNTAIAMAETALEMQARIDSAERARSSLQETCDGLKADLDREKDQTAAVTTAFQTLQARFIRMEDRNSCLQDAIDCAELCAGCQLSNEYETMRELVRETEGIQSELEDAQDSLARLQAENDGLKEKLRNAARHSDQATQPDTCRDSGAATSSVGSDQGHEECCRKYTDLALKSKDLDKQRDEARQRVLDLQQTIATKDVEMRTMGNNFDTKCRQLQAAETKANDYRRAAERKEHTIETLERAVSFDSNGNAYCYDCSNGAGGGTILGHERERYNLEKELITTQRRLRNSQDDYIRVQRQAKDVEKTLSITLTARDKAMAEAQSVRQSHTDLEKSFADLQQEIKGLQQVMSDLQALDSGLVGASGLGNGDSATVQKESTALQNESNEAAIQADIDRRNNLALQEYEAREHTRAEQEKKDIGEHDRREQARAEQGRRQIEAYHTREDQRRSHEQRQVQQQHERAVDISTQPHRTESAPCTECIEMRKDRNEQIRVNGWLCRTLRVQEQVSERWKKLTRDLQGGFISTLSCRSSMEEIDRFEKSSLNVLPPIDRTPAAAPISGPPPLPPPPPPSFQSFNPPQGPGPWYQVAPPYPGYMLPCAPAAPGNHPQYNHNVPTRPPATSTATIVNPPIVQNPPPRNPEPLPQQPRITAQQPRFLAVPVPSRAPNAPTPAARPLAPAPAVSVAVPPATARNSPTFPSAYEETRIRDHVLRTHLSRHSRTAADRDRAARTLIQEAQKEDFFLDLLKAVTRGSATSRRYKSFRAHAENFLSRSQPAEKPGESRVSSVDKPILIPAPLILPSLSAERVQALGNCKEPERACQWLRECFESDPNAQVLQVALWDTYKDIFAPFRSEVPLLPAKDFICQASIAHPGASACIFAGPGASVFYVKGITPRKISATTVSNQSTAAPNHLLSTQPSKDEVTCHVPAVMPCQIEPEASSSGASTMADPATQAAAPPPSSRDDSSPDPVIMELAKAGRRDPAFQALLRSVASNKASRDELSRFHTRKGEIRASLVAAGKIKDSSDGRVHVSASVQSSSTLPHSEQPPTAAGPSNSSATIRSIFGGPVSSCTEQDVPDTTAETQVATSLEQGGQSELSVPRPTSSSAEQTTDSIGIVGAPRVENTAAAEKDLIHDGPKFSIIAPSRSKQVPRTARTPLKTPATNETQRQQDSCHSESPEPVPVLPRSHGLEPRTVSLPTPAGALPSPSQAETNESRLGQKRRADTDLSPSRPSKRQTPPQKSPAVQSSPNRPIQSIEAVKPEVEAASNGDPAAESGSGQRKLEKGGWRQQHRYSSMSLSPSPPPLSQMIDEAVMRVSQRVRT